MRKLLSLLFICFAVFANARQITSNEAATIAADFLNSSISAQKAGLRVDVRRAQSKKASPSSEETEPYYVFNGDNDGGFVIISGDDRARKILGYSDKGNFDFNNLPPQLAAMLDQYAKQIEALPASAATDPSWSRALRAAADDEDGVLLETANWGQGYPYNLQTPIIDGEHCPTGCVATAMAIVMKYHNWPDSYDWEAMPNTQLETPIESLSKLMADAGEAVLMNYTPYESEAHMNWVGHKLQQDFKYSPDCQFITSQNFPSEVWRELIHDNLSNNNPIIYTGTDMDKLSSHAFVIDGYNEGRYHVNWGWDGLCNGYFDLEAFCPNEDQKFTANSGMVINISPDKSGKQYSKCFVDYGYFWAINKELGEAMNISVQDVRKGDLFHVINTLFTLPAGFVGEFGIAHVDKDGNIKEVLQTEKYNTWNDVDNEYKITGNGNSYTRLSVNNEVESTDRIQLVSRDNQENEYRLVLGTLEWPSWVPVSGNVPRYGSVKWEIADNIKVLYNDYTSWEPGIGSPYIELSTGQNKTDVLRGINLSMKFSPYDENLQGVILVKIEGPQIYGTTQYCDRDIETAVIIVGDYTVTAEWIELKEESVHLETAGTLKDVIPENYAKCIKNLEISGKMNALDFWYIRDYCPNLTRLDIQNIDIESVEASDNRFFESASFQPANSIPEWALTGLSKLEWLILPSSTDAILANSLSSMDLHFIEIPQNVTSIGMNAFYGNQHLDAVGILNPNPVEINECVFVETGCPSNACLYVPEGSVVKFRTAAVWQDFRIIKEGRISQNIVHDVVIENLVFDCYGTTASVIGYKGTPVNIDIPETILVEGEEYDVTSIKDRSFQDCLSLESIRLPNTITSIGTDNIYLGYTFNYCSNLKSVKLSENLRKIPAGAFCGCISLEQCVIPESVESIGMQAFQSAGLHDIYIPKNAKAEIMGFGAFNNNMNLKEYKVHPENPSYKSIDGVLYRTDGERFILESVPGLKNGSLEVAEECTVVDGYSIGNNINAIIFNETLDVIKDYAASGCSALNHIVLPGNATIYPKAFYYCSNLESVSIKQGSMPFEIFEGCDKLSTVYALIAGDKLDISKLFNKEPEVLNIYFETLKPDYAYNGKAKLWVPGEAVINNDAGLNNEYTEMWRYNIDNKIKTILIQPQIADISIDKVIINGNSVLSDNYCLYHYGEIESSFNVGSLIESTAPDVVVEYTLHGRQKMSTHYDAEFNAAIPSTDLSPVSEIVLSSDDVTLFIGNSTQITATVLPENAVNKTLEWISSDEDVATVDAEGNVTAVGLGEAIITTTATDGSGVSATCTVTVKAPERGDSNANGTINIADAVNTANYAVGNEVESFCIEAADVNGDGEVTVADASGTITIILAQPMAENQMRTRSITSSISDDADYLIVDDYSASVGETISIGVGLDNSTDYVALQADIVLPEGVTLQSVTVGERGAGHSITSRQVDDRRVRVALFDLGNSPFAHNNEALIKLNVKVEDVNAGDITVENIIASDALAHEYILTSTGGHNTDMTGIDKVSSTNIRVSVENATIKIYDAVGETVAIYGVDGRLLTRFTAKAEIESYRTAPGVYIVNVSNRMVKTVVK